MSINPDFEWLYPDLLQKEELIKSLHKRYIRRDDLRELSKQELVELYQKYIIPLPQRKYRQNRRGRQMTKQQVLQAKKRKHSNTSDKSEPQQKKHSSGTSGDRLKPPPSCINSDKKTVKLGSLVSASPKLSSKLDKLTLSKNKSSTETKSDSPEKKVKLNDSVSKESETALKNKTIELINKQMCNENKKSEKEGKQSIEKTQDKSNDQEDMDTSEPEDTDKKKFKVTKISWP